MGQSIYTGIAPLNLPGFELAGFNSPARREYLEEEALRTRAAIENTFELRAEQFNSLAASVTTPDEGLMLNALRTEFEVAKGLMSSARTAPRGIALMGELADQMENFAGTLEENRIARDAISRTATEKRETLARGYNTSMFNEIDPALRILDKIDELVRVSEVESPIAVRAVSFNLADILQGGGILTDDDVKGARDALTSWRGSLDQLLEQGTGGGLTVEARNNLLKVLNPLAKTIENAIARQVGRYGARADAEGFNDRERGLMFAGLDLDSYQAPQYELLPEPTAEEQEAARAERREATQEASAAALETVGDVLAGAARGLEPTITGDLDLATVNDAQPVDPDLLNDVPGLPELLNAAQRSGLEDRAVQFTIDRTGQVYANGQRLEMGYMQRARALRNARQGRRR